MSIKEQVNELNVCVEGFISSVDSLSKEWFLKKMNDWSPRDVLAHLIGWNEYTIQGCQQISRGETPFYFIDPGDDFSKVNAVLVQKYNSKGKRELVDDLRASAQELKQFLLSLDITKWEADYGVRYEGGLVTIKNTVDVLIREYILHSEQIRRWIKRIKSA